MIDSMPPHALVVPTPSAEWVEEICRQFETAWKSASTGEPGPKIEDYLPDASDPRRSTLLRELLILEIEYLARRDRFLTETEYLNRFPHDGPAIREALGWWRWTGSAADDVLTETQDFDAGEQEVSDILSPGQRVGRYTIRTRLGRGGFADVFLADDAELPRQVAIKVPRRGRLQTREQVDRFLDDARTAVRVAGPGIVAIFDVGQLECGTPFVVMEHIDGGSLRERWASQRPSPRLAAEWMAQIAEAVHHAHKKGFVHRDLKPANVLLDRQGKPRVADFGLALHESNQRSMAGECSGTPAYMAPEQVRGEAHRLDGRADVWALGVMLYEMLAGKRPFDGDSPEMVCDEILHRQPKPLRQADEAIPKALERICLKCLAKDVTGRYPTAADLAADLRSWLRPTRRSKALRAALAAGLAMAVALAVWLAGPAKRPMPGTPPVNLSGRIEVYVSNEAVPSRDLREVRSAGVLPLRPGDAVRFEASVSRPAYVYLVLIDSEGAVMPIYPWKPGTWENRPGQESRVARLSAPADLKQFWPVQGAPGMETAVLLARDTPLPEDVDLQSLLAGLAPQPVDDGPPLVEVENGRIRGYDKVASANADRSFDLRRPQRRLHAVLRNQEQIHARLRSHFPLIYAINLAHVETPLQQRGQP